jgi:very-short-patch-repair endonuclease
MDKPRDCVIRQLEDIRLKLLDLTNRNRLLNFKYGSGCIKITDELPAQVFEYLVKQGKDMTFLPLPEDDGTAEEHGEEMQLFGETDAVSEDDSDQDRPLLEHPDDEVPEKHRDEKLQTTLEPDLLETRLRRMRSDARSFIQETGNNHLFLAMGFLRWKERADAAESRDAPLVLVPIEIDQGRLNRKAQRCTYRIRYTGEDLVANLSLREKLRRDYGLDLPVFTEGGTAGTLGEEELDADAYFDTIASLVREMPGWEVQREMVVAFFTFAKLQMYLDLDPKAWSGSSIADNGLIQRLLGCTEHPIDSRRDEEVLQVSRTDSLPIVVDADSSQMNAIQRALDHGSMVIQGPPGTGKSQTITNLIACLVAQGKSVLFVAEKMAALEVVYRNLNKVGLASFCLELHSHKADKKQVIASLAMSYKEHNRLNKAHEESPSLDLERLRKTRDSLAEYIELLKKPVGPKDETIFDILGKAELLRQTLPVIIPLAIENVDALTHDQIENARDLIQQLSRLLCEIGPPAESPWYGYEPLNLFGGDEDEVAKDLQMIATAVARIEEQAHALFERLRPSLSTTDITYSHVQAICTLDLAHIPMNLLSDVAGAVLVDGDEEQWNDVEPWRQRIHDYRSKIHESSRFLRHSDDSSGRNAKHLSRIAGLVESYGLGGVNVASALQLRDVSNRLGSLLDKFCRLAEGPVSAGMPMPVAVGEIAGFAQLESLLRRRPPEVGGCACDAIVAPSVRVLFTRMTAEGQRLTRLREALADTFVLNDACSHEELTTIRRILRSTQGILRRALSSEYRRNRRRLQTFLRHPSLAGNPRMLDRLEALDRFIAEESEFTRDRQYSETFAGLFKGLRTDWAHAARVMAWITDVCAVCDSTSLAKTILNTITDSYNGWPAEGEILQVTQQIEAELHKYVAITSDSGGITGTDAVQTESIDTMRNHFAELTSLITGIEDCLCPDAYNGNASLSDILGALKNRVEAQGLRTLIETDARFAQLARCHFAGVDTDMDAIADSVTWALRIRRSGLPADLIIKLAEGTPRDIIGVVQQHIRTWGNDLLAIEGSIERLSRFGPVDIPLFLGNTLDATSLGNLRERATRAASAIGYLTRWAGYCRTRKRGIELQLGAVLELIEAGKVDHTKAVDAYLHAVYDGMARKLLRQYPQLATFTTIEYESKRRTFAELDRLLMQRHRHEIAQKAGSRPVPSGTSGSRVSDLSELFLLRNEFHKERRHLPIRQIMKRARRAIEALTPVFMMSPLSVAQFLEPGQHMFDAVIMDEASQIEPPDALGAIARARQMIIVGDSKQLPPTNFFDKTMGNPDDDQEETIFNDFDADQSILTKCEQLQFPSESLLWHYRSEHESLIAFSNARWYDNRLIIFPSSGISSTRLGIVYHYVNGATYTPGRNVNEVEGEYVARRIIEHARRSPELSLGVGTFNLKQRILIEDILSRLVKEDPSAELSLRKLDKAHDGAEPLFIKNLENLQGDERDVIFISCTFGPDKDGRVYQRFGPLAYSNGWRRLNVLTTRAKKRVEVFTSMRAEDITATPGQEGRTALKEYLKYAETGALPDYGHPTGRPPDSDFERAVAQVVRNMGYEVQPQVGVAGYFVDIGVRSPLRPDEYVLGIECDGAQYHSTVHARDRDRLREEVLRRRGWEIHRVWSTDWFKSREPEVVRLRKTLEALVQKSTPRVVISPKHDRPETTPIPVVKPHISDSDLHLRIGNYCRENIPRDIDAQQTDGFLNPEVLAAIVSHRITDRNAFREYVPVNLRAGFNSNDLSYLDDIFEIIDQSS